MFERAAVRAGTLDRAQQFVEEVAVAVLHVDEVEASVGGKCSGVRIGVDQLVEVVVREDDRGLRCDAFVEYRVVVRDPRL